MIDPFFIPFKFISVKIVFNMRFIPPEQKKKIKKININVKHSPAICSGVKSSSFGRQSNEIVKENKWRMNRLYWQKLFSINFCCFRYNFDEFVVFFKHDFRFVWIPNTLHLSIQMCSILFSFYFRSISNGFIFTCHFE